MGEEQKTKIDILLSPQEGMTGFAELRILIRRGETRDAVTASLKLEEVVEGARIPVAALINEKTFGSIKDLAENVNIRVMRTVYEQYEPKVEIEEEE